jgi:hypothetical protein
MMEKRRRFWRIGAALALGLFLVLMVLAPIGVAGDGGGGGGIPTPPPDTTRQNAVTPDTSTTLSDGTLITSPWLIWLF